MSSNTSDCSAIEARINEHALYISTTQDQINKLDAQGPDVQMERDALTRKMNALHETQAQLKSALEDCRQGKEVNFAAFDVVSEGEAG